MQLFMYLSLRLKRSDRHNRGGANLISCMITAKFSYSMVLARRIRPWLLGIQEVDNSAMISKSRFYGQGPRNMWQPGIELR